MSSKSSNFEQSSWSNRFAKKLRFSKYLRKSKRKKITGNFIKLFNRGFLTNLYWYFLSESLSL